MGGDYEDFFFFFLRSTGKTTGEDGIQGFPVLRK